MGTLICEKYKAWQQECEECSLQLKAKEEIKSIFIEIYTVCRMSLHIDLYEDVKVNYAKFQDVLAKIK